MASGDRYQITDVQALLAQQCLNVYYYKAVSGSTLTALTAATAFVTTLLPLILIVQSGQVTHAGINVINLDDPDDFLNMPLTTDNTGGRAGDVLPPYCCWAFRWNRSSRSVRNGQKRIPGIAESDNADGIAAAGIAADLGNLAAGMAGVLDDGLSDQFEPRIVHKTIVGGVVTGYVDYGVSSVEYTRISTQNTRKFGRGI